MSPKKIAISTALVVAMCMAHGWARAQSGPSVETILNNLTPTGNAADGINRGVRFGDQVPRSAPSPYSQAQPPVPHHVAAAAAAVNQASVTHPAAGMEQNLTITFDTNSAEVSPTVRQELANLAIALKSPRAAGFTYRIEGYTDNTGNRSANLALSRERASAIMNYLISQGVDASHLEAAGLGQDYPLVPLPPQTPDERNRRVRIVNISTT